MIRPREIRITDFDGALHARIPVPPPTWRERLRRLYWRFLPLWAIRVYRASSYEQTGVSGTGGAGRLGRAH